MPGGYPSLEPICLFLLPLYFTLPMWPFMAQSSVLNSTKLIMISTNLVVLSFRTKLCHCRDHFMGVYNGITGNEMIIGRGVRWLIGICIFWWIYIDKNLHFLNNLHWYLHLTGNKILHWYLQKNWIWLKLNNWRV